MPEGEEKEQEIENLFENFPNLAKEIDFQEVQEAQRIPKCWTQGRTHQDTSKLYHPRLKRRDLKSSKRKGDSYPQRNFHNHQLISQKKHYRQEGAGEKYSKS